MKKLILLLFFVSTFISCEDQIDELFNDSNTFYKLKIDTTYSDSATFSQISLPNHNFNITKQEQTFTLNKGILSVSRDVKATLNFTCASKTSNKDVLVNFYKDQTTIIKLTNMVVSANDCSLTFVVSYEKL